MFGFAVLLWLAIALAVPQPADARTCGTECGVPECQRADVRVRPEMTTSVSIWCSGVTSARVLTQAAHSEVTNVSADWKGAYFDVRPDADAPRFDEAVLELQGYEGSVEQRVGIEVVPRSENSPPVCEGDRVTQRSPGTGPVQVFMHPWCRDPDGDQFVIRGGPPGVHLQSPMTVPAGESESNWEYRTATYSGTETTTIWATDVLGARSEDADLEVTVGPGINRLPACGSNTYGGNGVAPIYSRPGAIRRFPVHCVDEDGDTFSAKLSSRPTAGLIGAFVQGEHQWGYWGVERWIDAIYVPLGVNLAPDEFSVTATGAHGPGSAARMAIVPRPTSENGGGGCGWSGAGIATNTPGVVEIQCDDEDGDPLRAEIVTPVQHGVAPVATVTPTRYGASTIAVPYVPAPGYEGYDCVVIRVSDGYGFDMLIKVDIWVRPGWSPSPPPLFPDPALPIGGGDRLKSVAQQALGTRLVERVRSTRGAEVWSRKEIPREDLLRQGQAPGVLVVCRSKCRIGANSVLTAGGKPSPRRRHKSVDVVARGYAQVLSLTVARSERRILRKARRPTGRFELHISARGDRSRNLVEKVPVGR
jgi:hypothetical protein